MSYEHLSYTLCPLSLSRVLSGLYPAYPQSVSCTTPHRCWWCTRVFCWWCSMCSACTSQLMSWLVHHHWLRAVCCRTWCPEEHVAALYWGARYVCTHTCDDRHTYKLTHARMHSHIHTHTQSQSHTCTHTYISPPFVHTEFAVSSVLCITASVCGRGEEKILPKDRGRAQSPLH